MLNALRRSPRLAAQAALWLSLTALAGCAAIRYEPIPYDSAKPDEAIPGCLKEAGLREGHECLALVRAAQWWSDTGVKVEAGQVLRITVPPGQVWFDADRVNHPPFGEKGSGLMNFYARFKRHPAYHDVPPHEQRRLEAHVDKGNPRLWFSLIAAVIEDKTGTEHPTNVDVGHVIVQAKLQNPQAECSSVDFTAPARGSLTLYPNDARGPDSHPTLFYENNRGQVWVRVRALKTGELAVAPPALGRCSPPG
jgi:hypothetical protein